ncbi:unnamed protein product, partial [Pylaiella littoralis]
MMMMVMMMAKRQLLLLLCGALLFMGGFAAKADDDDTTGNMNTEVAGVPDGDRDNGTLPLANQISASEGDKSGVLSLELLSGIDIDDNNEVDLGGTTKEQLALDT